MSSRIGKDKELLELRQAGIGSLSRIESRPQLSPFLLKSLGNITSLRNLLSTCQSTISVCSGDLWEDSVSVVVGQTTVGSGQIACRENADCQ